ncbi:hypothetical protein LZ198_09460 [Myxococcus sp. K15C18031901]|uniref:hypothetical protein n=1 Tax=Myxococcus dinghuensis TaxID=2906761 RepID=UPI0020A70B33|nr:hypothetical protein [Myxococcus dinghuensis]MCP3099094.1 hypothetical protein [Myxococcus dinghuensis]
MNVAVCVGCGETKEGAFTPCDECGLDPARAGTDRMLQARSLLLSERFHSERELLALGRKIHLGEAVPYDTAKLAELVEELKTRKLPIVSSSGPGCSILTWGILGMMGTLAAGLGWLWWSARG